MKGYSVKNQNIGVHFLIQSWLNMITKMITKFTLAKIKWIWWPCLIFKQKLMLSSAYNRINPTKCPVRLSDSSPCFQHTYNSTAESCSVRLSSQYIMRQLCNSYPAFNRTKLHHFFKFIFWDIFVDYPEAFYKYEVLNINYYRYNMKYKKNSCNLRFLFSFIWYHI